MALLDALAAQLATDGVGTVGTTIFTGYMPDAPDACVSILEGRGAGPEHVFGSSVVAIERPSIRVVCRAGRNDYPAARAKAIAVRASLGAIRNVTISSIVFHSVQPSSDPYPLGLDDKERARFGVDFASWVSP